MVRKGPQDGREGGRGPAGEEVLKQGFIDLGRRVRVRQVGESWDRLAYGKFLDRPDRAESCAHEEFLPVCSLGRFDCLKITPL